MKTITKKTSQNTVYIFEKFSQKSRWGNAFIKCLGSRLVSGNYHEQKEPVVMEMASNPPCFCLFGATYLTEGKIGALDRSRSSREYSSVVETQSNLLRARSPDILAELSVFD